MKNEMSFGAKVVRDFQRNKWKYFIVIPAIVYLILFSYKPMYGIVVAFQRYKPHLGIAGSKWVGLQHFKSMFSDMYFLRGMKNTIRILER